MAPKPLAPKPLAIARNWAEQGSIARILLAGLSRRPQALVEALAQSSRISFAIGASAHALVNKFKFDPGGLIAPIQHISRRIRA
jgi:hypothetical protein